MSLAHVRLTVEITGSKPEGGRAAPVTGSDTMHMNDAGLKKYIPPRPQDGLYNGRW